MVLIGVSILVASLSFLCYKHPPSSWSFVTWLQGALRRHGMKDGTVPPHQEVVCIEDDKQEEETKADLDRKAMPPPPPSPFRVSSVSMTSAPPSATKTTATGSASALPG